MIAGMMFIGGISLMVASMMHEYRGNRVKILWCGILCVAVATLFELCS